MAEPSISIDNLGKFYKVYSSPLSQLLHVSGLNFGPFRRRALYREFWALREFSLRVDQGERLGVIGENGAGKSTLLRLIASKLAPSEGTIRIDGAVQALFEAGTGFHIDLTGRENIRASLAYHNLSIADIAKHESDVIDFTELEAFIDQPIKAYSSGMLARLAFAVATCIKPKILIVDEILGAGDAYFAGKSTERMRQLTERNDMTVLFVSHDLGSVQRLCSRVVWIRNGRNFMSGKPHTVIKEYLKFVELKTDQRLRAREMRLSRANLQVMESVEGSSTPLLFRLRTIGDNPRNIHVIGSFELSADGVSLARLDLGAAMDNAPSAGSYIIDDPLNNNWGRSVRWGGRLARQYGNFGGKDGHAPFLLSVEAANWNSDCNLALSIAHEATRDENVRVEYWSNATHNYIELGQLRIGGAGVVTTVLEMPKHLFQSSGTVSAIAEPEKVSTSSEEKAEASAGVIYRRREARPELLRIVDVDFLDEDGRSSRVFNVGRSLVVRIRYEVERCVTNPVFAVTFFGLDGVQMTHQNTRLLGMDLGVIGGTGVVNFHFDPFRLGAGEYLVSVAALKFLDIENWGDPPPAYDRHDRRYTVSVTVDSHHFKNLGLVVQECSVSHLADSGPGLRAGPDIEVEGKLE